MQRFTLSSDLSISPHKFWSGMSMSAVNSELAPLIHMTSPSKWKHSPLADWSTGRVLFRSIILLFGVLPVDVHHLRLDHIYPGRGFLERSSSWTNSLWQHERTTTETNFGCIVTDTVSIQGRIPFVESLLLPIYRVVFRHRHSRLKALYGTPSKENVS